LLIVALVSMWIRVINFLRYNEYIGRFFGVVKRLIYELILFFLLYLLNLLLFALVAESSFRGQPQYDTVSAAYKTLFYASFGTFDFQSLSNPRLGYSYGYAYLIIFLCINIGLFMSLFVSIITVLFSDLKKDENIYQMIETLQIRSVT
jgi:hypothetical protein